MQAGDLRNKVTFCSMEFEENELGQDKRVPKEYASRWAKIVPKSISQQQSPGNMIKTTYSHVVTIRRGLQIKNDMIMMYKGQKYNVKGWQPVYNNEGFMEVFVEMEQNA